MEYKQELIECMMDVVTDEYLGNKSLSFILDSEIADGFTDILLDFVPLFYENTEADVIDVLEDNSFIVLTINRCENGKKELFVEPLLHDGKQVITESDLYLIQDELLDVVELDKLQYGYIILMCRDEPDGKGNVYTPLCL